MATSDRDAGRLGTSILNTLQHDHGRELSIICGA